MRKKIYLDVPRFIISVLKWGLNAWARFICRLPDAVNFLAVLKENWPLATQKQQISQENKAWLRNITT